MKNALSHFDGVDLTLDGYEGIQVAQDKLKTDELKDAFAKDFKPLMKVWESLSPDGVLDPYQSDFKWLSGVFESVRPASTHTGKLLWMALGNATTK